jgi:hypothetical protein
MDKIEKLQALYKSVCEMYIDLFCEKHDLQYDHELNYDIVCCSDYFFNFTDIRYDIDNEIEAGLIEKWYYDSLLDDNLKVNFKSYAEMFPVKHNQSYVKMLPVKDKKKK